MHLPFHQISSYLHHLVVARTRHGVHSPFVYKLIANVLRDTGPTQEMKAIEVLRDKLLRSEDRIRVNDLGAGSRVLDPGDRRVSDIARTALISPCRGRMMYRLARYFNTHHVLELGTSFGISTLYLALGAEQGTVTTLEGCSNTLSVAHRQFEALGQRNIVAIPGDFKDTLPAVLDALPRLDLAFIDGNHAEGPTLKYFKQCLARSHNDTVLVFDDIHWSRGMEAAWAAIKADPNVTVTIDLYDMGLVFLRREQAPEHFVLRY